MATTKNVRTMHPDVYDTIEFGALAFGGIGAFGDFASIGFGADFNCPLCVWGYAAAVLDGDTTYLDQYANDPISKELRRLEIYRSTNDNAVVTINGRKKGFVPEATRVQSGAWFKELGIVRGDAADFPETDGFDAVAEAVGNDSAN